MTSADNDGNDGEDEYQSPGLVRQNAIALTNQKVGAAIMRARLFAGIAEQSAADHIQMPLKTYRAVERGVVRLRPQDVASLADFLRVPLAQFFIDPEKH